MHDVTNEVMDAQHASAEVFSRFLEHIPSAFAVTRGPQHSVVYANPAFRNLLAPDVGPIANRAISEVFPSRFSLALLAVLNRALRTGIVARNRTLEPLADGAIPMSCTVWPDMRANGDAEHLLIELRVATHSELTLGLQREVAERLLLSALREQDAASAAEASRRGAHFLAAESRRLTESLDEGATLAAMERMALPQLGAWCIVDILDDDDTMHRLAIVHPDPAKQAILEELEGRWTPTFSDKFGVPAALRSVDPTIIVDDVAAALVSGVHDPGVLVALRNLGVGPLLTVPLIVRKQLVGAVTFVGVRDGTTFTPEEIEMAEDLASRSAMALDHARLYSQALALRVQAESASEAKGAFLGMVSHELRTPLNAIGGYVDLIDLGIHGPVTDAQRVDLGRIRSNQRYLMGLITDLLNFTKVGSGRLDYNVTDFTVRDALAASIDLVEPLIHQRHLMLDGLVCDPRIVAHADPEKVTQILVNLLSNSIKFTPMGGHLNIDAEETATTVLIHVSDTGIGIPADKLESIFEPFVQIKGSLAGPEAGVGLGLAISRGLARGMKGDLTVESTFGKGSCFTVRLPR